MTEKEVTISVRTASDTGSTDELIVSYETTGRYCFDNECAELSYDEPGDLGMGDVRTRFLISGNEVLIVRKGGVQSEMRLVPEKITEFLYSVSAGSLVLFTRTERLESSLSDKGGTALFRYVISDGEEKLSENEIELEIREV